MKKLSYPHGIFLTKKQLIIHNSMTNNWVDLDTVLSKIDFNISRNRLKSELSKMTSLGLVRATGDLYKIGYESIDDGQCIYNSPRHRLHSPVRQLW